MTPSRRQSIGGSLEAVRGRRELAEYPFGIKSMMGCPRFLMRGLIKARAELALVLGFQSQTGHCHLRSPTLRVPAATGWQREQCAGPVLDLIRRTPGRVTGGPKRSLLGRPDVPI